MKKSLKVNDAVVLFDKTLRQYLTGFPSSFGIVVITVNDKYFITDKRYFEAAEKAVKNYKLTEYTSDALLTLLKQLNIKNIYTVLELLTADRYINFLENGFEVFDNSIEIFERIAVKDNRALNNIRTACKIAEKAYSTLLSEIKEEISEIQLASRLEALMKEYGAEDRSFETIVAFGRNTAVPHHKTGKAKLKENQPVLIDFGCKYNGFCSDMTRSFYFGNPTNAYKNAYISVLNAHENAKLFIRENIKAGAADGLARDILANQGYAEYFTHSLGHGIGLEIHEYPYLRKGNDALLKEGMVFSIEPGVYFKGKFGIRIEDTVALINGRAKSFMSYTKELEYFDKGKKEKVKTFRSIITCEKE